MKDTTRSAITAILASDETVAKEQADAVLGILTGMRAATQQIPAPHDRVIKRSEAAKIFGVTTKTIDLMARMPNSTLKKVYTTPGSSRACGFTESSILQAMKGI